MVSKTRMLELIKNLRAKEVAAGLAENPALLKFRDERGRNWPHPSFRKLADQLLSSSSST